MGRYTTALDICQAAAYKIGAAPVTNIENPGTVTEQRLSFLYDRVRRYVLRVGVWNFAQKVTRLTSLSEDMPEGFSSVFMFPTDFIRFLGFVQGGEFYVPPTDDYMIANNRVYLKYYTDTSIWLKYISDFENVATMDDCFIDTLILRLAYELAYIESGKSTLVTRLLEEYEYSLLQAKMIDGQEQKPRRVCRSRWQQARHYGSSSDSALPYRIGLDI